MTARDRAQQALDLSQVALKEAKDALSAGTGSREQVAAAWAELGDRETALAVEVEYELITEQETGGRPWAGNDPEAVADRYHLAEQAVCARQITSALAANPADDDDQVPEDWWHSHSVPADDDAAVL